MHDVNHAIEFLRERTGLSKLALDQDGYAQLIFDGKYPVDIYRIDAKQIELASVIDEPDPATASREALMALLTANYLGDATGPGRVALDPRNHALLLCERIDVTSVDAAALERRVLDFVAHVALWNSGKLDDILEGRSSRAGDAHLASESSMMIRG